MPLKVKFSLNRLKIRTKLLALLLIIALVPILFLGVWAGQSVKNTRLENIQELEEQMLMQLNDRFRKYIDDKIESYRINIADPNVNAIGPDQQKFILNGLLLNDASLEEAAFISVTGLIENQVLRNNASPTDGRMDLSADPAYLTAKESKDYLSDIEFVNNLPRITIASPVVNQQNKIIAILRTKASLAGLSDMMASAILGEQGYSYVTDQNHKIIAVSERLDKKIIGETADGKILSEAEEKAVISPDDLLAGINSQSTFSSAKKIPTLNWIIVVEWPETDALKIVGKIINGVWLFTLILLAAVTAISVFFSRALLKPLATLENGAAAISGGDFSHQLEIKTNDEFADLGKAFNKMAGEIDKFHKAQKTKQKNLENAFGQYVGGANLDNILRGEKVKLGGERKYITVLFSDIKNFTTISESLEPEVLIKYLNNYLTIMSDIIIKHGGVIDKYIGDAIVAFWGAPDKMEDHAYRACLAAEEMMAELKKIQAEWQAHGLPEFDIRIGINSGGALVGNVGSAQRLAYTVIGDMVNLAARLEGINKEYKTRVMISNSTFMEVKDKATAREVDKVAVKGKVEGVKIYELIAVKNQAGAETKKMIADYQEALNLYRIRKWSGAINIFSKILDAFPDDGPSLNLMARAQIYSSQPPTDVNWDGTYRATEK